MLFGQRFTGCFQGAPAACFTLVVLILEDNAYGMIRWKQAVD